MRFSNTRVSRDTIESTQSSTNKWAIPPHPNDSPTMTNQSYSTDHCSTSTRGRGSKFNSSVVSSGSRPSTPLGQPPSVSRIHNGSNNSGSRSNTPLQTHRSNSFRMKPKDASPFQRNVPSPSPAQEEEEIEEYHYDETYRDDVSNVHDRILQFGGNTSRSSTPIRQQSGYTQPSTTFDQTPRSMNANHHNQHQKMKTKDTSTYQRNTSVHGEEHTNNSEDLSTFRDEHNAKLNDNTKLSLVSKRQQDNRKAPKQDFHTTSSAPEFAKTTTNYNEEILSNVKDEMKVMGESMDSKLRGVEERLNSEIGSRMEALEANLDVRLEEIYGLLLNLAESVSRTRPHSPGSTTFNGNNYHQLGSQKQPTSVTSDSQRGVHQEGQPSRRQEERAQEQHYYPSQSRARKGGAEVDHLGNRRW